MSACAQACHTHKQSRHRYHSIILSRRLRSPIINNQFRLWSRTSGSQSYLGPFAV
jgi:hypothetical protein